MNTSELENALNVLLRYNEHNEISCYVIAANELKNLSIRSYPAMIMNKMQKDQDAFYIQLYKPIILLKLVLNLIYTRLTIFNRICII